MSQNNYYSEEEYRIKCEIRRARVEAEKKRQLRNRKLFFGGLILLVLLALIITGIVFLVKYIKSNNIAPIAPIAEKKTVQEIGKDDTETLINDIGGLDNNIIADNGISVSGEESNSSEGSGTGNGSTTGNGGSTGNGGNTATVTGSTGTAGDGNLGGAELGYACELPKRYDFSPSDIVFSASENIKEITSTEYESEYGIMVDASAGKVIAKKNAYDTMYPASMTKVMTVLTARQYITDEMLDEKVTLSYNAISYDLKNGCSSAGFCEGETVTVRDLFYGTILPSGGEAAYMLAEYTAGTHDNFVGLMNENAKALGISDSTHFTNAAGIYDDMNYSTCYDLAVIMYAALQDDFLKEVLNSRTYTTSSTDIHPEGILISNWFLRRIEDKDNCATICAGKTGFVNQSGCCAVSSLMSESGTRYICVSGNAWSSWRCIYDHVASYNIYALGNTSYHKS
ncbi:MAG: serine hydrolase [Lachnospiraceae bacterium]|nr:serine hydrolase [Lachnospiraceae bacterium]